MLHQPFSTNAPTKPPSGVNASSFNTISEPTQIPETINQTDSRPNFFQQRREDLGFDICLKKGLSKEEEIGQETKQRKYDSTPTTAIKTLYVANIAKGVSHSMIWYWFTTQGKVQMIFYRKGQGYAFVRYNEAFEVEDALRRMNGRQMAGQKLRVEKARKDLLTRAELQERSKSKEVILTENVAVVEELRWSLLVVDKHHLSTATMYSILQEEGVTDVTLMKWGKHGVVVVCKTEVELHRCQQIASKSKHSFVYAQRFDPSATKQSRFIWVELSGVPVAAWSEASLDDMNVIWDEWLYVAKQSKELRCLDKLQVFIKTEKLMKLDKEVQMRFKGQSFKAKIREFDVEVLLDFEHPEDTIASADENKFGSETRKSKTASGKMMEEENSNFESVEPAGEIQIESTKEASRDIRIGFPRIQISNNVQGVGQDGRVSNVQTEPEVEPLVSCPNLVVDGVHGLEDVSMVPDTCEAYLTQADNPNVKEVQHPQDKKHSKCTSRACENLRKKAEERKSLLKSKATTCKNSIRRGSRKGNQKGQEELVQLQDVDLSEDVSEEDEWESTAVQIGKEVGADLKMKGIDNRYDPLWKDFVTNIISKDKYRGGDRKVGVETLRQEESQTPQNLPV